MAMDNSILDNDRDALVELNDFVRGDNGVYHAASAAAEFAYSDGQDTEKLLKQILSDASDLSSDSTELQAKITDWPTEYHLSTTRANLIRPLNLSKVQRVLELGCGCGSITRYLGEQAGLQVDSVEGSPIRAELAALRCADLPNVSISTANFNQIKLPQNYYDLVIFVGVTEYAGRFSEQATDQQALQDMLAMGRAATKVDGVTLVAIENRTGLKYLLGAKEDHYAVPYIGLDDYPDSTGIRTYTKPEWQAQIEQAGFSTAKFYYPFPDYKVPTLVLGDDLATAVVKDPLKTVVSRDYNSAFFLGEGESRIWQGLAEAGTLADHANSFLIFMADQPASIVALANFELAEYPIPAQNYVLPHEQPSPSNKSKPAESAADASIEFLRAELARLQAHSMSLQQTIDIMAGSSGWKWLNRVRTLIGKKSVR